MSQTYYSDNLDGFHGNLANLLLLTVQKCNETHLPADVFCVTEGESGQHILRVATIQPGD